MKIVSIEAVPYTIPYHHPMVTAAGDILDAEHVLIRVRTDEGIEGIGEAASRSFVYGESQESIVTAVRKWIEPCLVGLDPFAVEEASARLEWLAGNNTALGAVDIALHDIRGKAMAQPSWRLMGGSDKPLRVTRILSLGDPDALADEARQAVDEDGSSAFKIKVGLDVREDFARVSAVREAVGPSALIYVDANHGWTAEEAARALSAMTELDLELVEEPSPAEDRIGRRWLANQVKIPIMADESAPTLADAARELSTGAARALSIKTTRSGFTMSSRLVALGQALGARTVLGTQADGMVGTAASVAFAAANPRVAREPGELDYFTLITDHIVVQPLVTRSGMLAPSIEPGIGVEINEDKLEHYRLS